MTQQQQVYRLEKLEGYEQLKQTTEQVAVPKRGQVLVRLHAVSLNYRDLMVSYGKYGGKIESQVVPCSDGAGEIVQVGEDVTDLKVGDKVCGTFFQKWTDGRIPHDSMNHALGASLNGVLCQYRVFESTGVIKYPSFLSYEEASTLPCAALTAWNALAHNGVQNIGPNQTVLILGTGGVSVFGIQFALAAGARVIVTSSSDEKLQIARSLGVKETDLINYSKNANWDEKVNEITNGRGVDHVVEVGGPGTLPKSLNAVRAGGHVHMIGVLTQQDQSNIAIQVLLKAAILRGVLIGSLGMFTEMNKTIEHNQIRPVIDKVFSFNEAKDAYRHLESQKHVGKVVIRID